MRSTSADAAGASPSAGASGSSASSASSGSSGSGAAATAAASRRPVRRRLIAASLVGSLGDGVYVPLTMLFVHALTGLSLTAIGAGLTLAGLCALAVMPVVGVVIDRFGAKRAAIGALALRAVGFAAYPFTGSYAAFLAVALLVAVGAWAASPSQQALIGEIAQGAERDRLLAWDRSLRNAGMGAGSLAAAGLLALDGSTGFTAAAFSLAALFVIAAVLVSRIPIPASTPLPATPVGDEGKGAERGCEGRPEGYRRVLADRPYLLITAANFLIAFGYTAQAMALPVFLTRDVGLPEALAGVVFAVNTALVALLGVPVARLTLRGRRPRTAALGAGVFALSFAAFALLPRFVSGPHAVFAVLAVAVLYTAGELVHSGPAQSLSVQAAPDHLRGRYLSVYQLSWSLCRTVAPLLLGLLLDVGPWQLWTVLALIVLTGAATLLRAERSGAAVATPVANEACTGA
ncbi:MFS transporter [Streptomyces cavernicola]|uniref:MFS transporter n=1 Tax=Streptomyces cavernicola TaxID=3043613 RepID=A0ABT6S2H8_9ACTN|nr:MFS transporter [Streptomyces sp. B-S-A6]MDI3402225.1 MFS transporter [Streptomyces sp. B-S-A6]